MANVEVELDSIRGSDVVTESVRVRTYPCFLPKHSDPDEQQFIFGYCVRISNEGCENVQLLERRWQITDAEGKSHDVQGEGVIGIQPVIEPGETYEYTSFCPLPTRWGTMEGAYLMVRDDGSVFDANIDRFYFVAEDDEVEGAKKGFTDANWI